MIPPLATDEETTDATTVEPTRGTWVKLTTRDADNFGNFLEKFNLSIGASAILTVGIIYFTIFLLFTLGFILTVPRSDTQIFNVTLGTKEYEAFINVITDRSLQPLQVKMLCKNNLNGERINILFLMNEKLVIYKDVTQRKCYVRSSSGGQFQEENETFKTLIMGKNSLDTQPKPTVHYVLHPTSLSLEDQHFLLGIDEIRFCSNQEIYWITFTTLHNGLSQRRKKHSSNHLSQYDACLENIVIHQQKKWKS